MVDDDQAGPAKSHAGRSPGMRRSDARTWPEFMTAVDVAWVIGLADFRTVHKMIRRGELSATKVGNQYRIGKAAVLKLLDNGS